MIERLHHYWLRLLTLLAAGTVVMWLISMASLIQHIGRPFPGFLVEPPLTASSLQAKSWESHKAGLGYFDRLLTADGRPLATSDDLDRLVTSVPPGTPITYEYLHGGETRSMTVKTRLLSVRDALEVLLPWMFVGSTYLLVGIVAFWLNPRLPAVQAHLVLCLSMALVEVGIAPYLLAHRFAYPLLLSLPFMGAGYLHLALSFPKVPSFVQRRPYLTAAAAYGPAIVLAALILLRYEPAGYLGDRATHDFYVFFVQTLYAFWSGLGMLAFLAAILYATLRAPTRLAQQQAGIVLAGGSLTVGLTILSYFLPVWRGTPGPIALTVEVIGQGILPLSVAYAILRHQLFDIRLIIRRGILYLSLTMALAALYVAGAVMGHLLIGRYFTEWSGASVSGFMAALAVAAAFRPAHDAIRRYVDRLFLGERANALQALADFSQRLFPDLRTYAGELTSLIQRSLSPKWVRLVWDDQVLATSGMPPSSPLPEADEGASIAAATDHFGLTLELVASGDRQGVLQIGPRTSEIPYSTEEQTLLRVLAAHAAVALQAGKLLEDHVRLQISEGVARSLAAERESLLKQVVHDVRSDLTNINLVVHLGKHLMEEQAQTSIGLSMARIDRLLEEKIHLIKQGRRAATCQLRESLQGISAVLAGPLQQKAQTLELSLPDGEVTVPLSAVEFSQIVTNLLTNAHKFSPEGAAIRLEARLDDCELLLSVSDEGPGIAPDLFEATASGHRSNPAIDGHGFGLQIVEALLSTVGGRLAWHNGPKGAVVQATIPIP